MDITLTTGGENGVTKTMSCGAFTACRKDIVKILNKEFGEVYEKYANHQLPRYAIKKYCEENRISRMFLAFLLRDDTNGYCPYQLSRQLYFVLLNNKPNDRMIFYRFYNDWMELFSYSANNKSPITWG